MRLLLACGALALTGCSASVGGLYVREGGPHPHVTFLATARAGPVELMHSPLTQVRPVTDLIALSLAHGPRFGPIEIAPSFGLAWYRAWGECDETGHDCAHSWSHGPTLGLGPIYRSHPLRLDLRYSYYANGPLHHSLSFQAGVEL